MKAGHRPVTVTVCGRTLPISVAKTLYRCEICQGELTRTDNRLHCPTIAHRGLIHRDEARRIKEMQRINQQELTNFYTIKNGKVELLCQSKD